jgi:hypothetical protein
MLGMCILPVDHILCVYVVENVAEEVIDTHQSSDTVFIDVHSRKHSALGNLVSFWLAMLKSVMKKIEYFWELE